MNIGESRPALGPTMNSTPDPSSTPETQTHSAHVLVIDDSLVCRTQVKRCLVKNGLRVTELSDGVNAHETARELMPDVVVSDIQMPGLDGYEVCRALKGDEATPD